MTMGASERTAESARTDLRLRRLFETHRLAVLAYCMRRAPRWDAHDAAAEVFVVAWRRIDEVPAEPATLPWLFGVARRVLANTHRSALRRQRLRSRLAATTDDPVGEAEPPIIRKAEYQWVIDAVNQLEEIDREILFLATWEGLSHREIGEVLGLSDSASRKRLERARRRLGKQLERSTPGGTATVRGAL